MNNMSNTEKELDARLDKFCHSYGFGLDCNGCPLKTIGCDAKYLTNPEYVRTVEHELGIWEVNHEE